MERLRTLNKINFNYMINYILYCTFAIFSWIEYYILNKIEKISLEVVDSPTPSLNMMVKNTFYICSELVQADNKKIKLMANILNIFFNNLFLWKI